VTALHRLPRPRDGGEDPCIDVDLEGYICKDMKRKLIKDAIDPKV